jgi:3-hydroxyisobutyrate dehydrogenase-like beta-hydroxyacid dehydrogenase
MVGGDGTVLDRARPVFAAFADPVLHVGAVGTGQLVKLVNNVVLTANWSMLLDAFAMGNGFGVSSEMLLEVLRHGTASSRALTLVNDVVGLDNLPTRVKPLLGKDSEIAFDVARRLGAPLGLLEEVIHHLWARGQP